jgi:hypothetical protein
LQLKKKITFFFGSKATICLSLGLHKERPSYRRSLQLSKEAIPHFKTFSTFVGHFCPPGSGSGSTERVESGSNPDPQPCPQDESSAHDVNQRHVLLYGSGRGRDESSKQCRKLSKELLKLFGKRFSIDVYDCGKVAGIFFLSILAKNHKKIITLFATSQQSEEALLDR